MAEPLTVTFKDDVATLAMDDGKANAAGFTMLEALRAALVEARDKARAILLTGRPGVLSGGFDLKVIREGSPADVERLVQLGVRTITALFTHPQPVVVAATGHAVALGAFMTLTGDYRIGTAGDYRIGLNETAIGLELPVFGIELARARLTPRHLTEAAILARLYSPPEAVEVGFLDDVASSDGIADIAFQKARELAALDAGAFAANKLAFRSEIGARMLDGHEA